MSFGLALSPVVPIPSNPSTNVRELLDGFVVVVVVVVVIVLVDDDVVGIVEDVAPELVVVVVVFVVVVLQDDLQLSSLKYPVPQTPSYFWQL